MPAPKTEADVDAVRAAVRRRLLPWFRRAARPLPWRRRRTPYRVLVAELMLQQTRVAQATDYYRRFLRRFPSLRSLAAAPVGDVLKAWEGLGYYARARNLHRLARELSEHGAGRFPRTVEELQRLPGIGPYTAAALGSMAFGLDAAVVDGNVRRVLCRVFGWPGGAPGSAEGRRLERTAQDLLVRGRAGECNEAWMELGALVCTPRSPRCDECPLRGVCVAVQQGRTGDYPARKPRRKLPHKRVGAAVIRDAQGRYLIAQRRDSDMLGGLWEFPGGKQEPGETMADCVARELREELDVQLEVGDCLVRVRHAYSHFTMELHAHEARITGGTPRCLQCAAFAWVAPEGWEAYAFSRADLKIIESLRAGESSTGRVRE